MLPVAEALRLIGEALRPVPAQLVNLDQAWSRVLAADVEARLSHPPVAVSAMDGYAVRAADAATVPATLSVAGTAAAGQGFARALRAGEAVRILTGAPVPEGADAIVIQEDTERSGDHVTVRAAPEPGRFIRPAGLDFKAGDRPLRAGRLLSARDVALCAAMNVPWLAVRRRPRVAVLATGSELRMPGEPLGGGRIVNSNTFLVASAVRALGGEPLGLGIAVDEDAALQAAFAAAAGADLLVTLGGASVGDRDLVRPVLEQEGGTVIFHNLAMRPGKPTLFGRLGPLPVLGLPGNPVSVGVAAVVFLKPILAALSGLDGSFDQQETAVLGRDLPANDVRQDYLRSTLALDASGRLVATPYPQQDSAMLRLLSAADCLVIRPPHAPAALAGAPQPILRFTRASPAL
ncbi:MAG: gephyrin-like molybdotransferase Glp [Defluviicoccus sp.]